MKMINLENVGSEKDIPLLIETVPGHANKLQKALLQNAEKMGIQAKANESRGSDHLSFAEKGIAAVNLIQPDNAFAHSPTDTPEKISEQKLREISNLIVSTVI